MNALLVSMSINMYSQNGSTDWRQRPECSHILSQLQTFMTNKPIIGDKEFNSVLNTIVDDQHNIYYKLFMKSKPFCIIHRNNANITDGNNIYFNII